MPFSPLFLQHPGPEHVFSTRACMTPSLRSLLPGSHGKVSAGTNKSGWWSQASRFEAFVLLEEPDNWNYINRGNPRACLLVVPLWPHLPSWAGRGRACRAVFAAPHPPVISSRGSIKPQESGGEQLARGADPHHGSLQHGTRGSVPPTPTPVSWEGRRKHLTACPKIQNLESNPRPFLKDSSTTMQSSPSQ